MPTPLPSPSRRPTQAGFALAAVLWLLAGLTIVVALIADSAHTSAERVTQLRERTEFVRTAMSAQAHAEYWLSATRPRTAEFTDGAASVIVDDRFYQIGDQGLIALQDVNGLIDLNHAEPTRLAQFLIACGVPGEEAPKLVDTLADYIDADNLQRINGAEADSYQMAGLPPPRNADLLAPGELWDVLGWSAYRIPMEKNGCFKAMTTEGEASMMGGGNAVNLATAPSQVLLAAGLPPESVQDISSARGTPAMAAERIAEANALTGGGGMFGLGGNQASKTLRVTHRSVQGPWQMTYILMLDPENSDRPWSIKQLHLQGVSIPADRIQTLPWPADAPATTPSDASPKLPF